MRRYVIGDIHGCLDELNKLLETIEQQQTEWHPGKEYKLIFVGDYVDRGPQVAGVVAKIRELQSQGHIALMGNHEDMILHGQMMYATETLESFGGSIPQDVLDWIASLPKYYEDDTIIVAHAGAKPDVPMNEQTDEMLMWYRYQRGQKAYMGKHFYHGHTPYYPFIEETADRSNVDNGCVYGGFLSAAIVDDSAPAGYMSIPYRDSAYA